MRDSDALAVLMTCMAAWQQAILRDRKESADREGRQMAKVFCVFEQGWRVAANVGVAEWPQANFKLCRALGIANFVSLHKLTDFGTAGSDGSRAARIAQALVADAGCTVSYRQSRGQRPVLRAGLVAPTPKSSSRCASRSARRSGRSAGRCRDDLPGARRARTTKPELPERGMRRRGRARGGDLRTLRVPRASPAADLEAP
jgi:hypothetical protein